MSGCTDEVQTSFLDRNFMKIIRVFFGTVLTVCIFLSFFFIIAENAEILSDCTDEVQTSFMDRNFIKIIRVFYTTGSQLQSQPVQHFASRLFLPIRVGRRMFEGMAQTMYRIEAWLRLTGNDTLAVNIS